MRLIFTLCFLSHFFLSNGQVLSVNTSEYQLDLGGYINFEELVLTNDGSGMIDLALRLEPVCYQEGDNTKIQICAGALCFPPTSEMVTMGDGASGPLVSLAPGDAFDQVKVSQLPAGTLGSKWKLTFFDKNDPTNEVLVLVDFDECSLNGVTIYEAYKLAPAFPNPATDQINIAYEVDSDQAELQIFNILGQRLESIALTSLNGTIQVDISDYEKGTYMYVLTDGHLQSAAKMFVK